MEMPSQVRSFDAATDFYKLWWLIKSEYVNLMTAKRDTKLIARSLYYYAAVTCQADFWQDALNFVTTY